MFIFCGIYSHMTQYHGPMLLCHCRVYPIHYAPNTQYKTKHNKTIFILYGIYSPMTQNHGPMLSCHCRVYPTHYAPNTQYKTKHNQNHFHILWDIFSHGTILLCHSREYPIHYDPNTQYKTKHSRTIFIFYGIYSPITQYHGTMLSCHCGVYISYIMPLIPKTKQSTAEPFSYSMGYTLPWHKTMPPWYHVTV